MASRKRTKLIHEGGYVAAVEVELLEGDTSWAPYLSSSDAKKMDRIREALRREDIETASKLSQVYILKPI